MPKLSQTDKPKYRKHRASGQAVVTIAGRGHYLGPHGTKTSIAEYDRLVGEWMVAGRPVGATPTESDLSISELCAAYWRFAKGYYVDKDGRPTGEWHCVKSVLKWLKTNYGHTRAIGFGPLSLRALREQMIAADRTRGTVNRHIDRVRRIFKWAASEELLPVTIHQTLATVSGLRQGKTEARETDPIEPADDAVVDATLPFLPPIVADMVRLQRLTGMRPGEVCILRPCDVDTASDVWTYKPRRHKTEHKGKCRVIAIGPQGQDVLRKYLLRAADAYCFAPSESERKRNARRRDERQSPMTPSQAARKAKRGRSRPPGDCYTNDSYRRVIHRACDKAGVVQWAPNQIRHAAATAIRKRFGLEAAQVALGHSRADVTQIYAEKNQELAAHVAREVG